MRRTKASLPFWLPIWLFAGVIGAGTLTLSTRASLNGADISWVDALFTATSAVCVTGLGVVDTGTHFTRFGQSAILLLIQLGGLGIMTYTSLAVYLMGRRVTLTDRIAVGQSLLHDPSFHLGRFLLRVVIGALAVEGVGALLLHLADPEGFPPFHALFHAVSAFCNAGFGLRPDSLIAWRGDWGVSLTIMLLITLGGLGFYVINDLASMVKKVFVLRRKDLRRRSHLLTWHSRLVLETSLMLSLGGGLLIFGAEMLGGERHGSWSETLLASLFQSVTCRTAGFNTLDLTRMTNISLVLMLLLMFIGGSPGSCAGGVKTTTFRAWIGFILAQVKGRSQTRVGWYALSPASLNRALTLLIFSSLLVLGGALLLTVTEGGDVPYFRAQGQFLENLFEATSAFGTVGLSLGITPRLTTGGKLVIIMLMFVGRLGPIWLLTALQSWQTDIRYRVPENDLPLG
ncbi:potassium transporter TrkH [Desulfovibrio aminophilus]|nr:potassium transporter TrkG [Desulfovibrio aminophilus]MCM0756434.1 potassium transporter TrkH [Desulfovibrio aminophilus]